MGLIQTAFGAAGSVLGDQWKEYFYSEALPADVIVAKGKKKSIIAIKYVFYVNDEEKILH